MTGIQVILAFSIVIILVALGLLIWGREQGTGTIKIFGMELTANSPLLMIALGVGLFLYAILQPSTSPAPCIVFCPRPALDSKAALTAALVYGPTVRITSGGTSDGHSPFCNKRTVQSCAKPEHGGLLVPGSGNPVDVSSSGRVGSSVVVDSPEAICIEFWAATTACETEVSIQGRAAATEKYESAKTSK